MARKEKNAINREIEIEKKEKEREGEKKKQEDRNLGERSEEKNKVRRPERKEEDNGKDKTRRVSLHIAQNIDFLSFFAEYLSIVLLTFPIRFRFVLLWNW